MQLWNWVISMNSTATIRLHNLLSQMRGWLYFAVNSVCRRLRDQAMHLHEPMRAILPLQCAIRKLQPSSEYLTAIHADYLQMCLLSKCYKASLSILEDDIFEIDQKKTSLVPRDFLLYCYYGYVLHTFILNTIIRVFVLIICAIFTLSVRFLWCIFNVSCPGRPYWWSLLSFAEEWFT